MSGLIGVLCGARPIVEVAIVVASVAMLIHVYSGDLFRASVSFLILVGGPVAAVWVASIGVDTYASFLAGGCCWPDFWESVWMGAVDW